MTSNINNYKFEDAQTQWITYKIDQLQTEEQCQAAAKDCQILGYIEKAKAISLDALAIFSGISLCVVALAVGKVTGFMVGVATLPLQFIVPLYGLLLLGCTIGSAATFLYMTLRPLWNKLKHDAKEHWAYAEHLQQQRMLIQMHAKNLKA